MQNCTAVVICTQRPNSAGCRHHSPESCPAQSFAAILFSYISGLLEHRAIFLCVDGTRSVSADVLKLDDDCPPFLSQLGLWSNNGAATRM